MNQDETSTPTTGMPWPALAMAAWLVPGLGHWLFGLRVRAAILSVTIFGLFLAGLFIGGIGVIDRRQNPLWFGFGQVHAGVIAVTVSQVRISMDKTANDAPYGSADAVPAYRNSVGRVNEMGTLYCALAGGLNLLCVLDIIGRASPDEEEDDDAPAREPEAAA